MMTFIWKAYDLLSVDVLSHIDCSQADENLERNITELLELKIHEVMTGDEPFYVQHNSYEYETAKPPPAQPPEYDIAFIMNQNSRIKVPLEAKVLKTDGTVADYIRDLKNEFLTCRYAPFVDVGVMLGYLLSGNPKTAFQNIGKKSGYSLMPHPNFSNRNHRVSDHTRSVPAGKTYPSGFRCHHLMMPIG